jgi:hypothetical protein
MLALGVCFWKLVWRNVTWTSFVYPVYQFMRPAEATSPCFALSILTEECESRSFLSSFFFGEYRCVFCAWSTICMQWGVYYNSCSLWSLTLSSAWACNFSDAIFVRLFVLPPSPTRSVFLDTSFLARQWKAGRRGQSSVSRKTSLTTLLLYRNRYVLLNLSLYSLLRVCLVLLFFCPSMFCLRYKGRGLYKSG